MAIEGSSVYDDDVAEIMKRLEAKGILLIVVDGKKNNSPIEFASAITRDMFPRILEVLYLVGEVIAKDLIQIREREMTDGGHGPC